jgi:hypothetical protein
MYTFIYHQDPGHGWVAVRRSLLAELGLLDTITSYSYQRGAMVYLEEDLDAGYLFLALKERGIAYTLVERHIDARHWIRSYDHFTKAPPRRALREGDTVALAGVRYILRHSMGRRGWAVDRCSDGMAFRMPAAQAKRAELT